MAEDVVTNGAGPTGADVLVDAAVAAGVEVCFTNPGTTELDIVAALDRNPALRPVLALFEGVATGAADGYGRVTGRPAMSLLHLGPGLGNGIANLHNAKRARTPLLNIVGEHATWHAPHDSTLASDIASLARPVSQWVHTVTSVAALADDVGAAVGAAYGRPSGVATLIVPADCQWDQAPPAPPGRPGRATSAPIVDEAVVASAAALKSANSLLLIGGNALGRRGLRAAARIQAATGCQVLTETFCARVSRGAGLPSFKPLPYFPDAAVNAVATVEYAVLAGLRPPITSFASRSTPAHVLPPTARVETLADVDADAEDALEALAELLGGADPGSVERPAPALPSGQELNPLIIAEAMACLLPEDSIVVDESATSAYGLASRMPRGPEHISLALTGGAIGMGLPVALGAGIAAGDRRTVAYQADGSAMYTPQALWSMAREQVNVTVVILANRRYRILSEHMTHAGLDADATQARALTDLSKPEWDWAAVARGMGVDSSRVATADDFVDRLRTSLRTPGPFLIEAMI